MARSAMLSTRRRVRLSTKARTAADGRHLDDLALDQLDAIAFAEDADLGHPVVLLPCEPSPPPPRLPLRASSLSSDPSHRPGCSLGRRSSKSPWKDTSR